MPKAADVEPRTQLRRQDFYDDIATERSLKALGQISYRFLSQPDSPAG